MKQLISITILMIAISSMLFAARVKQPLTWASDCEEGDVREQMVTVIIDSDADGEWDTVLYFFCDGRIQSLPLSIGTLPIGPTPDLPHGEITSGSYGLGNDFTVDIFTDSTKTEYWATMTYNSTENVVYLSNPTLSLLEKIKASNGNYGIGPLNKFDVYPNPAQSEIIVTFDSKHDKTYNVDLYDVNGVVVTEEYYISGKAGSQSEIRIPIESLSPGVYRVRMASTDGKSTFFKKVIIE